MVAPLVALVCAAVLLAPAPVAAQDGDTLVEEEEIEPTHHSLVGVGFEYNGSGAETDLRGDTLFGLHVGHRWGWFEVSGRLLASLNVDEGVRHVRSLAGLTTRAAFEVLGLEWTYGVGVQFEVRLDDHYWLLFAVPAELGLVVIDTGSWHVRVLGALRVLATGRLIDNFVLDPTGINNPDAERELRDEKDQRFDGYVGIAFTREID